MSTATIQALETGDETWYVLRRPGHDPLVAHWPHPLLELEPDAQRIASIDGYTAPISGYGIVPASVVGLDADPIWEPGRLVPEWLPQAKHADEIDGHRRTDRVVLDGTPSRFTFGGDRWRPS